MVFWRYIHNTGTVLNNKVSGEDIPLTALEYRVYEHLRIYPQLVVTIASKDKTTATTKKWEDIYGIELIIEINESKTWLKTTNYKAYQLLIDNIKQDCSY